MSTRYPPWLRGELFLISNIFSVEILEILRQKKKKQRNFAKMKAADTASVDFTENGVTCSNNALSSEQHLKL